MLFGKTITRNILIGNNTCRYVYLFRMSLIHELQSLGYRIIVIAPEDSDTQRLIRNGIKHEPINVDNGANPLKEIIIFLRYMLIFLKYRPFLYLAYTHKPNIYGSIAANILNIPVINNISGLGTVFIRTSIVTKVVCNLYKIALRRSDRIFFQNEDDLKLFEQLNIRVMSRSKVIPGSGVDLDYYFDKRDEHVQRRKRRHGFHFLLIARMLWDKGIGEFIEAAKIVKSRHSDTEFSMAGPLDTESRAAIPSVLIAEWVEEGVVDYIGFVDDVRPAIESSDCVVLPSYREGTPRSLLEAASMGKPLIASDAVGCREVVDDGANGFLCQVGNSKDLAMKMQQMILLDDQEYELMARKSREKAVTQFDQRVVVNAYLDAIRSLDSQFQY